MGQTGGRPGGGGGPALQCLRRHAAGKVASRSLARCREGARRRGRQAAGQRHSGRQGSNESTTQSQPTVTVIEDLNLSNTNGSDPPSSKVILHPVMSV
ncbi:Os09g0333025 [Oryza sativa Japonica Group]|uniref:Os09g0333025 protein n=1 Tax=Oryza sativa subsp. japonica TaxID=39947 RepID=A0A0P0XLC1_ORYSJ|nr:Os09g0333025 [Oryza sativa Japonica Group]